MFRRKADSLPTFVADFNNCQPLKDVKKEDTTKSRLAFLKYSFKVSHVVVFGVFCCICLLIHKLYSSNISFSAIEFGSYLSSDFYLADEENETTMLDIMKRHPYNNIIPDGGNAELKYSSTILKTHARPRSEEDEFGNIIFFSFHGRVGSESILSILHHQYGYQDGGNFILNDIHKPMKGEEEDGWGSHDPSEDTEEWQSSIIARVEKTFSGYGARDFRRKMVHVRMADAWTNDVSVGWLMEALRDVGGVTHMVLLTRNPLRAKISDIASTRFKDIISPSTSCGDQKFLYDVGRSEALEMAVSQHYGFREAMSVEGIQSTGVTYEHDILPNYVDTMSSIASFLWDPARGSLPPPQELGQESYRAQMGDCDLSQMIHNFKELECVLANTALSWIVESDGGYTFKRIMELGDDFKNWMNEQKGEVKTDKLLNPAICRIAANNNEVQRSTLAVRKRSRRCGHGGHTPVCNSYGPMKSFMCSRLLALTNGQCDSFTYSDGNCYLHDETVSDFWEGDCESSAVSFLGYLRFPEDR